VTALFLYSIPTAVTGQLLIFVGYRSFDPPSQKLKYKPCLVSKLQKDFGVTTATLTLWIFFSPPRVLPSHPFRGFPPSNSPLPAPRFLQLGIPLYRLFFFDLKPPFSNPSAPRHSPTPLPPDPHRLGMPGLSCQTRFCLSVSPSVVPAVTVNSFGPLRFSKFFTLLPQYSLTGVSVIAFLPL